MRRVIRMTDIKIVASGTCAECGHSQKDHEGNTICDVEGCDCTNIGSYWFSYTYIWEHIL